MATFTDDFNRAGPALGSPWATVVGAGNWLLIPMKFKGRRCGVLCFRCNWGDF